MNKMWEDQINNKTKVKVKRFSMDNYQNMINNK